MSGGFSRRDLLVAGVAGALALPREGSAANPYGPFRMGIQSYSLRGYNVDVALQKTRELGLEWWESFAAHIPLTNDPEQARALRAKLKAAGVNMYAHGVTAFGANKEANRKVFEAAKLLGVKCISADPTLESFDQLEELVEEFKINIAIHNHGPGARWDKLDPLAAALKGRHPRLGACADLGHFLRSREESVRVLETLGERVHGVHLKDVKDATRFTILGQGDMNLVGVLKTLKAIKYKGIVALEYEENPKDPIADIQQCLAAVRAAVEKI